MRFESRIAAGALSLAVLGALWLGGGDDPSPVPQRSDSRSLATVVPAPVVSREIANGSAPDIRNFAIADEPKSHTNHSWMGAGSPAIGGTGNLTADGYEILYPEASTEQAVGIDSAPVFDDDGNVIPPDMIGAYPNSTDASPPRFGARRLDDLAYDLRYSADGAAAAQAVRTLSHYREPGVADVLIESTQHPAAHVRLASVEALWRFGAKGVESSRYSGIRMALQDAQTDIDPRVAAAAQTAIRDLDALAAARSAPPSAMVDEPRRPCLSGDCPADW